MKTSTAARSFEMPMSQPPYADLDRRASAGRNYQPARGRPRAEPIIDRTLMFRLSLGLNVALLVLLIGALRPFG